MANKDLLHPSDIAATMSLTTGRVYQLIRAGKLPSVRVGGRILIPRVAWDEWLRLQSDAALSHVEKDLAHA